MHQITKGLLSWASILEDATREQAVTTAGLPWVRPHVALMPDAHWGMGSTVGSVIPTDDVVMPAAVGVDIGCGMAAVRTQLTADDIAGRDLAALRAAIEREIPLGAGQYRATMSDTAAVRATELEQLAERRGVDPDSYTSRWREQLGTLGSGNHFLELCLDEADRLWVFLHSGSRGIGNKIARHHVGRAQALCARWHVDLPHRDLAFLPVGDPAFTAYLKDLHWAQAFALANRAEMLDRMVDCLAEWYAAPITRADTINCHHNYTVQEHHYGRKMWITRKGAIRAGRDDRGLIPGSMGTRSFVVRGLGNAASFCSAPHGAGRNFSRNEARKRYTAADLTTAMAGIEWRADIAEALVDEIPGAYKPVEQVLADAADLVAIEHELRQILNVKGT